MTPIENKLGTRLPKWSADYIETARRVRKRREAEKLSLVDFHKKMFGRQSRTFFNGEFKFWIWEMGNWTVYVSNKKGFCFEVPEASTLRSALTAWQDYKERLGVTL